MVSNDPLVATFKATREPVKMGRYIKDFRARGSGGSIGPNDLRNPNRPSYSPPPHRGTGGYGAPRAPSGPNPQHNYGPSGPVFTPAKPKLKLPEMKLPPLKLPPLKGKSLVPSIPYTKPLAKFGDGVAKFLGKHPAFRAAQLAGDLADFWLQPGRPAGWDMPGGEVICDTGGPYNAFNIVGGGNIPLCGTAGHTTHADSKQPGGTIPARADRHTVYLGWSPYGIVVRMTMVKQITYPDGRPAVDWTPATAAQPRARGKTAPDLTDVFPWLDPDMTRPTAMQPHPYPPPMPLVNMPRPGRITGPKPATGTKTPPAKPPVGPPPTDWPPIKERKTRSPWAAGLMAVWDAAGEAGDIVDAVGDAIPGKPCSQGSLSERSYCIVQNADKINLKQALQNLVANHLEDQAIGGILQKLDAVGIGVGFNGVPYVK